MSDSQAPAPEGQINVDRAQLEKLGLQELRKDREAERRIKEALNNTIGGKWA